MNFFFTRKGECFHGIALSFAFGFAVIDFRLVAGDRTIENLLHNISGTGLAGSIRCCLCRSVNS